MVSRKPVSWFLTERGRQVCFAVVTGTGLGFTAFKWAPHTLLIEKYKNFVHYYSNGKPVELPLELKKRCEQCLEILNIPDVHKKLISPFSVYGFDLFHAGTVKSKFGAAVGIPVNFRYKSLDDILKDSVQVNQQNVDWESEVGKKLANAIILPEKVQQFAICREILMCLNHKVLIESVYPFASIFFVYNLSTYLNRRLNLYAAPRLVRGVMYTIVGMFGLGTYCLMKDMTQVQYEVEVDKQLCDLGPEFIESGVIFYNKLLERNQALRELMGQKGKRKYTTFGNENYLFRQPHLALVHRKSFFEQQLQAIADKKNNVNTEKVA